MDELGRGRRLGPYQIENVLGQGGMATVYQARQESLGRFVALKVLAPDLARDPEFAARFQREATTAARLEHPQIVPIYDVGQADGWQYIAMRYVAGGTLAELLARNGALPLPTVLTLLAQVAEALDHAHAQGVIHRDLKPGNILLEPTADRASLTDFGIARAGEATRLTRVGQIAGTPEYMAPEQAQGQPVDARSDLYALGVIAYEMLTGRVPFEADSGIAVLHQHVHATPPPLRPFRPDVPSPVEAAVKRMLAKAAEERFQSAAGFIAAFSGYATPAPLHVRLPAPRGPRTPASQTVPPIRRGGSTWLPIAAGAAALAIIVGAVLLAPRPSAPALEMPPTLQPLITPTAALEPKAVVAGAQATAVPTTAPTVTPAPPTATAAPTSTPVPEPPALVSNDFGPRSILPGDVLTLTYEITDPGSSPMRIMLGASIRGGGTTIDDPANDETVTVQPGRGMYQRIFRVPPGTPPGRYDVVWGLIGPARENLGLKTASGALTIDALAPPPVPAARPIVPVAPPAPAPAPSPADSVRQYYLLIGARNFSAARAIQGPRLQSTLDYSRWVAGYDTTRSVEVPSVSTVSQSGSAATVAVTIVSVDADSAGHTVRKTFQGTWDLTLIGGEWKLQNSSIKQVG